MRVLLGVTGGIAAYKVAVVLRRLKEDGHDVRVVPTAASLNFVGRATWEALSGHPARHETFDNIVGVEHVRLGQDAQAVLIAPATADFLATMAAGQAPDLLSNALLATEAPVVVFPAMHTEMWQHRATQANVAALRERGVIIVDPAVGRLTGADSGPGRLPEPGDIVTAFYGALDGRSVDTDAPWGRDLAGLRVVISAGGTREPLDAVRFLGNYSTGHQGFALAQAAQDRGADVTLVAANVTLPAGEGIRRIDVTTTAELGAAMRAEAQAADVVIMAAAVADFTSARQRDTKIKKDGSGSLTLELVETEDILASLVKARAGGQVIVGFAAETGDDAASALEHGVAKARRKGADLMAINAVGPHQGFGDRDNEVYVVDAHGAEVARLSGPKLAVSHGLWDAVRAQRG